MLCMIEKVALARLEFGMPFKDVELRVGKGLSEWCVVNVSRRARAGDGRGKFTCGCWKKGPPGLGNAMATLATSEDGWEDVAFRAMAEVGRSTCKRAGRRDHKDPGDGDMPVFGGVVPARMYAVVGGGMTARRETRPYLGIDSTRLDSTRRLDLIAQEACRGM